jgi:hypothetical protein
MSTPSPSVTEWVPLWKLGPNVTGVPLPVVNGRFVKGVGGAAVWTALSTAEIPGMSTYDAAWRNVGAAGEPGFQDGWSNYGSGWVPARYRKLATGVVVVQGFVVRGAGQPGGGSPIFNLPAGYRPRRIVGFGMYGNGGDGYQKVTRIDVQNDGQIVYGGEGANAIYGYLSLCGIAFPAEQ